MCAGRRAPGVPEAAASECGTLCHEGGTHGRSDRCRRSFMLPILVGRGDSRERARERMPRLGKIHNGRGILFPINVHGSVF